MNHYLLRKKVFALVFTTSLFGYSFFNAANAKESLSQAILENKTAVSIENAANENIFGKTKFIEGFSLIQKFLNKYEFNNFKYVKDLNGFMHYSGFYQQNDPDVFDYALRMKRLKDYAEKKGKKLIFCLPPAKFQPEYTPVTTGLPVNDPKFISEQLLFYLKRFDIEILDLYSQFPNSELPYEECFFKTDHHWTIPAAYQSSLLLKEKLNSLLKIDLDPTDTYLGENSYTEKFYPGIMLGSMGRATGLQYTGLDDFWALFPNFDASYVRQQTTGGKDIKKTKGNYKEVILDMDAVEEKDDLYNSSSSYSLYLDEITDWELLETTSNPDGPKALMIRDSYFGPVMAFLSPMFSSIESVWSLTDHFSIDKIIQESEADVIIVEVYPHNINDKAFNFFRDPAPNEKVEVTNEQ